MVWLNCVLTNKSHTGSFYDCNGSEIFKSYSMKSNSTVLKILEYFIF